MKVAVLMGGVSGEREVSLRSGAAVARGLRTAGHDVCEVDVRERKVELPDGVEAVFIALHGEFGEDGGVQEILEDMGMPYTGAGVECSQVAINKVLSKRAFVEAGIPTAAYQILESVDDARRLVLPVVVKPACTGSSLGVHRVQSDAEWDAAVKDAFSYGGPVLVEEFVHGRELTVGIVGEQALPVVEIVAADGWYGYEAKYTSGTTRYVVPAEIDTDIAEEAQRLALRVFEGLGCEGLGRVDFILTDEGDLVTLELNTIPGFTETSLLPKAAKAAGMDFAELCDRIIAGVMEKF